MKADSALVMVASQGVYGQRTVLANLLGMKPEQVRVQFREGAGCYGKNLQDEPAQAAAVMSQIVGKPVRVQLTRDQEHGWDFYGPATLVDIRGGVDANGKIVAYDYVSFQQGWNSVETTAEQLGHGHPDERVRRRRPRERRLAVRDHEPARARQVGPGGDGAPDASPISGRRRRRRRCSRRSR